MKWLAGILGKLQVGPAAPIWHRFAPSITLSKRFKGARLFYDARDNVSALVMATRTLERREWPLLELPKYVDGPVWDIGANVGYLTVAATVQGKHVVAFEMSTRAVELMEKTRATNGLSFDIVPRAFAVEKREYTPPLTSHPGNQMAESDGGGSQSITYQEAEEKFGTPEFIKMDIEGMEKEFFACAHFKKWILDNRILLIVEVHSTLLGFTPVWDDVPHVLLPSTHYLYCGDQARLKKLLAKLDLSLEIHGG